MFSARKLRLLPSRKLIARIRYIGYAIRANTATTAGASSAYAKTRSRLPSEPRRGDRAADAAMRRWSMRRPRYFNGMRLVISACRSFMMSAVGRSVEMSFIPDSTKIFANSL